MIMHGVTSGSRVEGGIFTAAALLAMAMMVISGCPSSRQEPARILDSFDDATGWKVYHSDDVSASRRTEDGAVCLDFDFNDVAGFASFRRNLPLNFSGNYALTLRVRGEAPVNTLQIKLIDASGDNVWWVNRPKYTFNDHWQTVRAERRQIMFAWGPAKDHTLRRAAAVEIAVVAEKGGSGWACFDDFKIEPLPPSRTTWPIPVVRASSSLPEAPAGQALDGKPDTAWRSDPAKDARQTLDIDFMARREFGGLVLHWLPGMEATRYSVRFSDDGRDWRTVRRVVDGNGGTDPLLLTESHTRFVRLSLDDGPSHAYGLSEIEVKDLAWGATPNVFFEELAKRSRRGLYPRAFSGEQSYWTVLGVDGGGAHCALISEDGAVETGRGGFSVEPFLIADGHLLTWADVSASHTLLDGYLPIPGVTWKSPGLTLHIDALASGDISKSHALLSYTVKNDTGAARNVTLSLAVRPFQVNPPTQFLNVPGGVSPIYTLDWDGTAFLVDGKPGVLPLSPPDKVFARSFDAGNVATRLETGSYPQVTRVRDEFGYASGAMVFNMSLPARGIARIGLLAPLSGMTIIPEAAKHNPVDWMDRERDKVAAWWRKKLNGTAVHLPPSARAVEDTFKTSLAYILISRNGPALQPGTRSYARSWIRDGAMMSEALLRVGLSRVVGEFMEWYAPHQFSSGKVPCCVDERGADPVPENDSNGELVFTVAELYRFTRDKASLKVLWPNVSRDVDFMDFLRSSERIEDNLAPGRSAFYGLMPASISHEGYSAKPVHSYWDDFWALRGYDDAVYLAKELGLSDEAQRLARARDQFRGDLAASIRTAVHQHNIDYLPGSAELGDFDPTSSTIVLSLGDAVALVPGGLIEHTFSRYWDEFTARTRENSTWGRYTPYELRNIAAFTRLGWRNRIQALPDFFMAGRRPGAWNGWAEVVCQNPREPGFIGDMPHAWIASDFMRAILDMLAYVRASDAAVVLAAGVPTAWIEGEGVGISGLHTPWGKLSYGLRREGDRLHLDLEAVGRPPGGFIYAWPHDGLPGEAKIDGRARAWSGGELKIGAARAKVDIVIPASAQ